MRGGNASRRHTEPPRGSIAVGEGENEPTGLMAKIYGRERLVFSRQQICDDLLDSLPKLHAALRSKPFKNEQLWRRTSSENAKVKTFELVGMPPNDGAVDGTDVSCALAASTQLQCHLNEVLNVLVSQKSSDYEATMQALSGKRFEAGELLYSERCRLLSDGGSSQALLGVQMTTVRPSWKLLLTPSHLCHPEHPSTQRLCFASLTHRYTGADRAVHVLKTLPKRIHDQIIPRDYHSALRGDVDHLGIAFDIDSKTVETGDRTERRVTRIFAHAYVASPRLESSAALDHRNGRPRSRTSPELWDQRGPSIVNPESKHVLALLTSQLKEFERVIGRRRFGFQSFIYFQPPSESSTLPNTCQICLRRFSLFRREFYCQICGHLACGECSQLYEVEARVGQVRKNCVCLSCVVRVDSCTFADEDILAALGPTVVPLRRSSEWFRAFSGSEEVDERSENLVELGRILLETTRQQKESMRTQLERHANQTLRDSQHKFPSSSLKTAELVRDYRYTFDASITTYEGHPLPPSPSAAREARRLHHIQASGVLEPEYDHSALDLLAQVAAQRLNCPIGFVSLIDDSLFHSVGTFPPRKFGLQAPRTESMCSHTVYADKPLVIKNAQCDLRFAQLPVVRDHGIQFYFGFPIRAPDGSIVASLCTSDRVPHNNISTADYAIMQTLADVASQLVAPRDRVVSVPYQPRVRSLSNCRMKQRTRSNRRVKREPSVTTITTVTRRLDNIHCV
ncbi:hypothetical protein V7S43_015170 [Phytophthora oleae]|uniref:FYVE-type domain-containing protein n=1 Tax=Phytophthora oleae TaxID=2107226 RepID=A0ABD3EZG0_9STRA